MPHIHISGYSDERVIKSINLHAEIDFKSDYFKSHKAENKLKEIQGKLENVLAEYFEDYSSDSLSNHEWNLKMNEH